MNTILKMSNLSFIHSRRYMLYLHRRKNEMSSKCRKITSLIVKSTKWDAFFLIVSGIVLLTSASRSYHNEDDHIYLSITTFQRWAWLQVADQIIMFGASVVILLGVFRIFLIPLDSASFVLGYVLCYVLLTMSLVLCMASCLYVKNDIRFHLNDDLLSVIHTIHRQPDDLLQELASAPSLTNRWDHVQMTMHCCGAVSYRDYINGITVDNPKEPLPHSCCVLRSSSILPQPDNLSQCQLDASRGRQSSVFINAQGCELTLDAWITRYVASVVTPIFSSTLLMVMGAAYFYLTHWNPG